MKYCNPQRVCLYPFKFWHELEFKIWVEIRKDASIWITLTIVAGIWALKTFLKRFLDESGKLLAQRLFQAADKAVNETENPQRPVKVQLIVMNSGKATYITGKDESEFYQNLLESTEKIENGIIQESEDWSGNLCARLTK